MIPVGASPLPTVAHYRDVYSGETFISYLVSSIRRYRSLVVTRDRRCPQQHVHHEVHVLSGIHKPEFWLNRAVERRFGRRLFTNLLAYRSGFGRVRPTILHCHFGNDAALMVPVAEAFGLPMVASFYGFDLSLPVQNVRWASNYRKLFMYSSRLLVEGPEMRRRLVLLGCPPDKIEIVRLCVPVLAVQEEVPIQAHQSDGIFRVLVCCRFVEKKGVLDALRAFAILRKNREAFLTVIGDGPLRPQIQHLITELKLESSIVLLGAQPLERFYSELLTADCFLQPSKTAASGDTEGGAPTTLIEAQLSSVPIVATRHADIPFIVANGKSGFLADEGDFEALARHLASIADDPSLARAMAERGKTSAMINHSSEKIGAQVEAIYDRSIAEFGKRG